MVESLPPELQDSYASDFRLADAAFSAGRLAATSLAREARWRNWQTYVAPRESILNYNRQRSNDEFKALQDSPSELAPDTMDEDDKFRLQQLQAQLLPLGRRYPWPSDTTQQRS